jgi:peptidase E
MSAYITKAQDKALLAITIQNLPDSYARSILSDLLPEMERAIDSDFGFIPFAMRARESEEYRREILAARNQLDTVKAEIRELERTRAMLSRGLDELRSAVRQFSKL